MSVPTRYRRINFTPTRDMRRAAEHGLELRRTFGRGGLSPTQAGRSGVRSGVARARDIVEGEDLSPDSWRAMRLFFLRHARSRDAEGSRSRGFWGDDSNPSAGYVAHLLWGGDAGFKKSEQVVAAMVAADEQAGLKPRKAPRRNPEEDEPDVPEYVREKAALLEEKGYDPEYAYRVAWSIACKYKRPRPGGCTKPRRSYFRRR